MTSEFDHQRPAWVKIMFVLLFSELLFIAGILLLIVEHKFWAILPLLAGVFLFRWCFHFACPPAKAQPDSLWKSCVQTYFGYPIDVPDDVWIYLSETHPNPSDAASYLLKLTGQTPVCKK